jgi:hypothetical protein
MSDYLFARPSFLAGMARVADLGGALDSYNDSPTEAYADANALFMDFWAVGKDLYDAYVRAAEEAIKK